ncbi:MAG: peptidase Ste24p [Sphingobacteriales bacterium]|nr:peptidase Ste24p [Sphingobacteriales bacterium]
MDSIPVLFYDGQTSIERKALLILRSDSWIIDYSNTNHLTDPVTWELDKIGKFEIVNGNYVFRYGTFPQQVIILVEPDLISQFKHHYPEAKFLNEDKFKIKGWKKILAATLTLITLLLSVYFFILPPISEFFADQIPQNTEIDLGSTMLNSFMSGSEENRTLSVLVNKFSKKIDFETSYPIKITVVKSNEINAFALPGGNIVIYEGILEKIHSADQLAALLSHEVAHIEYKHSIKSISRSISGYIFISLILNDINGFTTVIADHANTLKSLSYSRQLETDADDRATQTLDKNNISQQGMVSLLMMLNSKSGYDYLKFLSTHPLTKDRISKAKRIAHDQKKVTPRKDLNAVWKEVERSVKEN